jgi:hypothetical protein
VAAITKVDEGIEQDVDEALRLTVSDCIRRPRPAPVWVSVSVRPRARGQEGEVPRPTARSGLSEFEMSRSKSRLA